jgi:hypothetical protein
MAFLKMCLADNLQDATDCGGLGRPVSTNLNVKNFNISSSENPGINILEDEKKVVENTQALSLFG